MNWIIIAWAACGLFWMLTSMKTMEMATNQILPTLIPQEKHHLIPTMKALVVLFGMLVSPILLVRRVFLYIKIARLIILNKRLKKDNDRMRKNNEKLEQLIRKIKNED